MYYATGCFRYGISDGGILFCISSSEGYRIDTFLANGLNVGLSHDYETITYYLKHDQPTQSTCVDQILSTLNLGYIVNQQNASIGYKRSFAVTKLKSVTLTDLTTITTSLKMTTTGEVKFSIPFTKINLGVTLSITEDITNTKSITTATLISESITETTDISVTLGKTQSLTILKELSQTKCSYPINSSLIVVFPGLKLEEKYNDRLIIEINDLTIKENIILVN